MIILDYLLPGKNGLEVCKILKGDTRTKNIPIIFLTVVESGEAILECYGSGAESYLHKPIDVKALIKEVELMLSEGKENEYGEEGLCQ